MAIHLFGFIQRLADWFAVFLSFAIGYWIYHWDASRSVPYGLKDFLYLGFATGWLFVLVFRSQRLYEAKVSLLHVVETRRLLLGWGLSSLILFAATFYLRFLDLSRLMVSYSLAIALIVLLVERALVYQWQISARLRGKAGRNVIIYGAGKVGRHLYKRIFHSPGLGLHVLGFLDDDRELWGKEIHMGDVRRKTAKNVLGGDELIGQLARERGLREVFVAMPNATQERNLEIVQVCRRMGLSVSVVPPTYGHQMHAIEVEDIGGIPVIREKESRPYFLYPFLKRSFDLFVSLIILIGLSPLFALLALIVRCDSEGPIIFRQRRVGQSGREFDFFKFRTMYVTSNPYAQTPNSAEDPRITRFGRWLRRSSLDELPQFWNVLRGDMSIVGPRPEMPFIVATYNEEQRERLSVRPGITGVWQISAVRGEPIHANPEYDLFYIEHRSMLLDLIIMVKTVLTAIRGIGAI